MNAKQTGRFNLETEHQPVKNSLFVRPAARQLMFPVKVADEILLNIRPSTIDRELEVVRLASRPVKKRILINMH